MLAKIPISGRFSMTSQPNYSMKHYTPHATCLFICLSVRLMPALNSETNEV